MKIAIHQPNYLPWWKYFYKIFNSDIFVILDDVLFSKNSVINRNKIKNSNGFIWLTVPVKKHDLTHTLIKDVIVSNNKFKEKHLKTFYYTYKKSAFFHEIYPLLEDVYNENIETLSQINLLMIKKICTYLSINTELILSSSLSIRELEPTLRIMKICQYFKADTYLSGLGAKKYMNIHMLKKNNVKIQYITQEGKIYPQLWGEFIPNLSFIDVLFNLGRGAIDVIR